DPVTALAAKANIDALAVKLRDANREGSLQHLRALVMTELLQGRDPLDQLTAAAAAEPGIPDSPADEPADRADWPDDPGYRDADSAEGCGGDGGPGDGGEPGFAADPARGSADAEERMSALRGAQPGR